MLYLGAATAHARIWGLVNTGKISLTSQLLSSLNKISISIFPVWIFSSARRSPIHCDSREYICVCQGTMEATSGGKRG